MNKVSVGAEHPMGRNGWNARDSYMVQTQKDPAFAFGRRPNHRSWRESRSVENQSLLGGKERKRGKKHTTRLAGDCYSTVFRKWCFLEGPQVNYTKGKRKGDERKGQRASACRAAEFPSKQTRGEDSRGGGHRVRESLSRLWGRGEDKRAIARRGLVKWGTSERCGGIPNQRGGVVERVEAHRQLGRRKRHACQGDPRRAGHLQPFWSREYQEGGQHVGGGRDAGGRLRSGGGRTGRGKPAR